MRTSHIISTLVLLGFYLSPALAQFDDLYFDREAERKAHLQNVVLQNQNQDNEYMDQQTNDLGYDEYLGYEFDQESEYYSDYDYAYSARIRRFHRPQPPLRYYSSFDYWYNDYYYDPFYDNAYNVNVFIGTPVFGWNRWNRWNSYNTFNSWGPNRWNRWNSWNSWGYNDPWGWNSYGWNSWNYCPPVYGYYGGNMYYTNVYNNYYNSNTGNNNGGWGSNGVASNIINKSRRDGALVTSTSGRNTTRRTTGLTGDPTNPNVPVKSNDLQRKADESVEIKPTNRIYRGDIKNTDQGKTPVQNTQRGKDGISEPPTQRTPVRTPKGRTDDDNSVNPQSPRNERAPDTRTPDTGRDRGITPSAPTKRNDKPESPRKSNPTRSDDRMESNTPRSSSSTRSGGGSESTSPRSSSQSRSSGGNESSSPRSSSSTRSGGGYDSSSTRNSSSSSSRSSSSGSSSRSSGSNRSNSSPRGGG